MTGLRIAVVVVLLAALAPPVTAAAATPLPACPARPADYTGTDPVVGELRAARQEAADVCAAQAARLDQLDADEQAVGAAVAPLHGDLAPLDAHLGVLDGHVGDVRTAVDAVTAALKATPAVHVANDAASPVPSLVTALPPVHVDNDAASPVPTSVAGNADGQPLFVQTASAERGAQVHDTGVLHADLWWLVAAGLGCFFASLLARAVFRP